MSHLPSSYSYSEEHEWIDTSRDEAVGRTVTVGITSIAAERLGEIVYVDLPGVGDRIEVGETCGEVESTKSVSDIYAPVTGTVIAVNEELADAPEIINSDPFGAGYLFKVEVEAVGDLLDAESYASQNG